MRWGDEIYVSIFMVQLVCRIILYIKLPLILFLEKIVERAIQEKIITKLD